jgi:uncharacterized protein (TIGR03089 family)
MTRLTTDLLTRRAGTHGGEPLLTYYDLRSGERTELSAITVANWVDKTANLIVDEIGAEPGDRLSLPLAAEAPGHWITFVWELACWRTGVVVDLTDPDREVAVVCGPTWQPYEWREVYACALHPLGFGFSEPLAAGVRDYAVEVRSQPDAYVGSAAGPDDPAWHDGHRSLTQAGLLADLIPPPTATADSATADSAAEPGDRRLVVPSDPWTTTRDALLVPLVAGGSSVVAVGGGAAQLAHVAATERAVRV